MKCHKSIIRKLEDASMLANGSEMDRLRLRLKIEEVVDELEEWDGEVDTMLDQMAKEHEVLV